MNSYQFDLIQKILSRSALSWSANENTNEVFVFNGLAVVPVESIDDAAIFAGGL